MKNFACPPGSLYLKIYFKRLKSHLCCLTNHQAGQRRPIGAHQPIKDQQHALKGNKDAEGTAKKVARRIIPGARNNFYSVASRKYQTNPKKVQGDRLVSFLLLVRIFAVASLVGYTYVSLR